MVIPITTSLPKFIKDAFKMEMSDRKPKKAYEAFDPTSGCEDTAPFDVYWIPAFDPALRFLEERSARLA